MMDKITCFKLNWHNWGLCCAEDVVQEEITIYRNNSLLVIKELNGYDNKISTGEEAAEHVALLKQSMEAIGYQIVTARGDWKGGAL